MVRHKFSLESIEVTRWLVGGELFANNSTIVSEKMAMETTKSGCKQILQIFYYIYMNCGAPRMISDWSLTVMFFFDSYDPSKAAAILFAVLYGITTLLHIIQMFLMRKWYCWALIMGGVWEVRYIGICPKMGSTCTGILADLI